MKQQFIETLTSLMEQHDDIIVITADMGFSVFENLQKKYPSRFINTGVTEQASVSIAAGLALSGYKVFFYAQASFATMRCFEQLHLDVAYNNVNVKVIGVNGGVSLNQLGVSHFAVEDIGIMRTLPNFKIFSPSNAKEMKWALEMAYKIEGPVYLRYTKLSDTAKDLKRSFTIGKPVELLKGKDAVLFSTGGVTQIAREAITILQGKGISISLFSVPTIKPLDKKTIVKICKNKKAVFTLEEHSIIGGLGSAFAEIFSEDTTAPQLHRLGIKDKFIGVTGTPDYLLSINGISAKTIASTIKKLL